MCDQLRSGVSALRAGRRRRVEIYCRLTGSRHHATVVERAPGEGTLAGFDKMKADAAETQSDGKAGGAPPAADDSESEPRPKRRPPLHTKLSMMFSPTDEARDELAKQNELEGAELIDGAGQLHQVHPRGGREREPVQPTGATRAPRRAESREPA